MFSSVAIRNIVAAAATACTASIFWRIDCNPSLFLADKLFQLSSAAAASSAALQKRYPVGKCIWIIGASSGIGEQLAYQLAAATATQQQEQQSYSTLDDSGDTDSDNKNVRLHLILSSRSRDKLDMVASHCRSSNPACKVTVLPLNVCREKDLHSAVKFLSEQHKHSSVDTVVMNSGGGHLSPALETSAQTAESVWRLNALWPMVLTPLLFQYNIFGPVTKKKRPHLVVTASIASVMPVPLSATYAAAKHAVLGYFRSLQAERPDILIHTVMPGPVDTNFHQSHLNKNENDKAIDATFQPESVEEASVVTSSSSSSSGSEFKMPVQRCARLIMSSMRRTTSSSEAWIAQQPVLTGLYLQKFAPSWFLQRFVYGKIGPKRVRMWRAGLDLYDPSSWKQQTKACPDNAKDNNNTKKRETK